MLHFSKSFVFFASGLVAEKFTALFDKIQQAKVFGDLRLDHDSFLNGILDDLFLTSEYAGLLKGLFKVLSTCALFSAHLRRFLQLQTRRQFSDEKFIALIKKFNDTFDSQTRSFLRNLEKLGGRFSALQDKFDFSGFYSG